MPRNVTITLDNGRSHVYRDVPDDVTPEQVAQRASSEFGGSVKHIDGGRSGAGIWDTIKGLGSDIARGAMRSAASNAHTSPTAGLSVQEEEAAGLNEGRMSQAVQQMLPTPTDSGAARKMVRGTLEGVGGALTSGAPTPVNLISGGAGGLGGEIAEKLAPNNPLAKLAGTLVGGVGGGAAASLVGRARPQSAALAREAVEGFSPDELNAAQAFMNKTKAAGTDIDLAQALHAVTGREGNLTSLRNAIAGRRQGDTVQQTLNRQPEQLSREAELTYAGLPGKNYSQQGVNNLQETATARLKQATTDRSNEVRGLYAKAGDLAPDARDELISILRKEAEKPGATEVLKARAGEMMQKLSGKDAGMERAVTTAREALDAATTPAARVAARETLAHANRALSEATGAPLKALDVDTWISELRGPWQGQPLKVAYPKEQGQIKGLAGTLNKRFQELSPEVAAAEARFQQITQDTVNPLKQGPVGTLSGRSGYDPATGAPVSRFEGMLARGSDSRSSVSELRTATRELGKVDPTAIDDALKSHVSTQISKAMDSPRMPGEAPTNPDMAKRLYAGLFKDDMQWQGLKDVMVESAKVKGANPTDVIRGMENLKQITFAMTSRPAVRGGISPEDLKRLGGSSNTANAVRIMSFLPANRAGEMIERATLGKTLSQFDAILTSPEGVKMLMELGRVPVMSKKAQVILGTYGASLGNPPGLMDYNPPE